MKTCDNSSLSTRPRLTTAATQQQIKIATPVKTGTCQDIWKASDPESMTAAVQEWRERNYDDGVYFGKTHVYVGMIFPEAAEVVA